MLAQLDLEHMEADSLKIENYLKNQSTLSETEKQKWIIVNNEKVDDAKLKVEQKTEILANKKNLLDQAEVKTLTEFDATEKYHFKAFSVNYKENIDTSNKYFQTEMQKTMHEEQHQYEVNKKEDALEDIAKKTAQVEFLNNFTYDYDSFYKIARQGVEYGFGRSIADIKIDLLDSLEKILPFDRAFLEKHFNIILPGYITTGKRAKWAKVDITKNLVNKSDELKATHIPKLNGEIESLKNIITDSDNNLEILDQKIKNVSEKLNVLEAKYLEKLSPEQKISFQNRKLDPPVNKPNDAPQDWTNAAAIIDPIIAYGFANFKDKDELSKYFADQIIYSKYDLRAEPKTKAELAAERELLIREISIDELSGFTRNQKRAENRVYDYFYAKVTRTEKKRHHHRGERILKPVANEIVSGLTGGLKPFKNYKGGEDNRGQSGLQFTYRPGGNFSLDIHKDNVPIYNIYESKKPKPPIPEFSQPSPAITPSNLPKKAENFEEYRLALPSENLDAFTSSSSLTADNPAAQAFMASIHKELTAGIDKLGMPEKSQQAAAVPKSPLPKTNQPKGAEKTKSPERNDDNQLPAKPAEPVVFREHNYGSTKNSFLLNSNVDAIPAAKWVSLAKEAFGEFSKETCEAMISFNQKVASGGLGMAMGSQALPIIKFFGEDLVRLFQNQDTETKRIAKEILVNFENLNSEEKIKAGFKLFYTIITPAAANKVTGKLAVLLNKVNAYAAKLPALTPSGKTASKGVVPVTAPNAPKPPANLPKDSENLDKLASKLQEVRRSPRLNSDPKTFAPQYELKQLSPLTSAKDIVPKLSYIKIVEGVSKAEARNMLKNNPSGLTQEQLKTVFKCLGDGRADKINVKIDNFGMVRLSMERPGRVSGFQRMSYKIDKEGSKTAIIQTAFNNESQLVHQKPGVSKNNVYDVKKYIGGK